MLSNLLAVGNAITTFFAQVGNTIGYVGLLAIFLGIELLFIILFAFKSVFSYEAKLKRSIDRANSWLFKYKKVDINNIKMFNAMMKTGPKRFVYYWQQYILYREGAPSKYLSEENIIEKPLRTSSWNNNVKNLGILTIITAALSLVFGIASQILSTTAQTLTIQAVALALVIPGVVVLLGGLAIIIIKARRVHNLNELYHMNNIFARFIDNGCADLPEFIDFDLLFTKKDIEKGNAQLREYYEARARKAKEEFENAKKHEVKNLEYDFKEVGVDGALLLDRAMKESEAYINKKTSTEVRIDQIKAQKDALRRNYENVQMDLQRKIQASKENIQKLIEQQAATTSRVEVGLLRQQQEKEINKQEAFQKDYDQEEARYKLAKEELDKEAESLGGVLVESRQIAEKGMESEYQSFLEKVMKSAYVVAEKKVDGEKKEIQKQKEQIENELINIQTQIKRLHDENITLRAKVEELTSEKLAQSEDGHYDEEGNYIYNDGSFHDTKGLFHDVDGKIYDMNGVLVGENAEKFDDETKQANIEKDQIEKFGAYIPVEESKVETPAEETTVIEEKTEEVKEEEKQEAKPEDAAPAKKRGRPRKVVSQEEAEKEPAKKRGRPRKVEESKKEEVKPAQEPKKRGRPRKEETAVAVEEKPVEEKKKRGRPKKEVVAAKEEKPVASAKKRGRSRKTEESGKTAVKKTQKKSNSKTSKKAPVKKKVSQLQKQDLDALSKINQLISEEEAKLSRMKALLNSEIDQVMVQENKVEVEKEKDSIMEAVETLKEQANDVKKNETSNEELASINKRLEDLIKEISLLNSKK